MPECQTAHRNGLPPEATQDQIQKVKRACEWDKIRLGSSAQYHVIRWQTTKHGLRHAVLDHIDKGRKVFRKFSPNTPDILLEMNLQANVSLTENKDVYVEMILTDHVLVILNAHEHSTIVRLPQ